MAVPYVEVGADYAVCPGCFVPHRVTARGRLWIHGPRIDQCFWSRARVHQPIGRVTRGRPVHVVDLHEGMCA